MIPLIPGAQAASSALEAERVRMEVISQNIAQANITRTADGKPYQRQQVVFESVFKDALDPSAGSSVRVSQVRADTKPPRLIYNPGHPDADADGMVAYPDINIHEEMADLIVSSRAFEANLAVIRNAKHMALQTLQIGKR
ncbi:MAG TPA: flagellar basal body rod protein FlgC [Methylomirabilota bacterium]|nr:flagellar basal body rod protein FlgC [Methylomirabilota bacterium]